MASAHEPAGSRRSQPDSLSWGVRRAESTSVDHLPAPTGHRLRETTATRRIRERAQENTEAPEGRPEDFLDRLRQLVEDGQVTAARRLTTEAARRFPDDPGIRLAQQILAEAEATPNPLVQPTAAAESEWLDHPPEEARGKWVALIGSELVGMADSVEELMESLKSKNLGQLPLVHHLAA